MIKVKKGLTKEIMKIGKERNKKWKIQDREAGNEMDEFDTLKEAEKTLKKWEKEDKKDGNFTPDFYEIVEVIE